MKQARPLPLRAQPVLGETLRVARFAVVGVAATVCHYLTALGLGAGLTVPAQLAHLAGFAVALPVSFLGHYHWTFKSRGRYARTALRFFAVAGSAYLASALVLATLTAATDWEVWARFFVSALMIPAASYVINRFFVF